MRLVYRLYGLQTTKSDDESDEDKRKHKNTGTVLC